MAVVGLHADQLSLSTRIGGNIYRAGRMNLLTDAGVEAADTIAGLESFIDSVAVHADQAGFKDRIKDGLRKEPNITDVNILALTTVAGLVALTNAGANGRYNELLGE